MSLSASRAVLRQSRSIARAGRRFESTTTKATEAAKDTAAKATEVAKDYKSKAGEGLSRVSSSAGPAIAGAAQGVSNALGKIGGPVGSMIKFVERQIPPTIYYARVGLELGKLVFRGQKMTPPSLETFQAQFQTLIKNVRRGSLLSQAADKTPATPEGILNQIRNINSTQLAAGAVVLAEVLGFFTVGEMIGRFKLIGYRGDTGAHH